MHFFNYLCFNYLCLKLYNLGWRCSWGSSLPYRRRLPSQSGSSALLAGSLLLTATGLPPRWWKTWWCSSAICDCWETCLLCEKPTCFALFDFDIQYICTYLGKPVLIWENNIWTSGFWFWFSDVFWILFIVFWSLCLCLSVFLSFRLFVLVNIYEFILVHN